MPAQEESLADKLTSILRDEFDDPSLVLRPDMTAADVENWDSLTHINLITAIERTWKVRFTTAEVMSLKNVGDLLRLITKKLSG